MQGLLWGTSLFYYLSVQYINVSIAIVLLMQSVWFSVVVESFINKKLPTGRKVLATIIVLVGTVLATNLINMDVKLDIRGVFGDLWQQDLTRLLCLPLIQSQHICLRSVKVLYSC